MTIIYAIQIILKNSHQIKMLNVVFKTVEKALDWIKNQEDYAGEEMIDWQVETPEIIYQIKPLNLME